jgi:hypothetical protein
LGRGAVIGYLIQLFEEKEYGNTYSNKHFASSGKTHTYLRKKAPRRRDDMQGGDDQTPARATAVSFPSAKNTETDT